MSTPRSHIHPRDLNNLEDLQKEVRKARRAINGAAGRKARKLKNREEHRAKHKS